jgi:hypothetical protein
LDFKAELETLKTLCSEQQYYAKRKTIRKNIK